MAWSPEERKRRLIGRDKVMGAWYKSRMFMAAEVSLCTMMTTGRFVMNTPEGTHKFYLLEMISIPDTRDRDGCTRI